MLTSNSCSVIPERTSPLPKKRRLVGPKSEMIKFEKRKSKRIGPKSEMLKLVEQENKKFGFLPVHLPPVYIYQPLSLLNCALNAVNSSLHSDFSPKHCTASETAEVPCALCGITLENVTALAEHQLTHLHVTIGPRVDDPRLNIHPAILKIRKTWSQSQSDDRTSEGTNEETEEEGVEDTEADEAMHEQNLLIPVDSAEDPLPEHDVCIVNGIPTVNGRPLAEYTKEERRKFYRTIIHNGIKRKFCNLCRYTFKDNWTIECHYFSNSCYYTCRFCGARFTKYKNMFAEHLKSHKGQQPSSKIFGQIKKPTKANPYVKRRSANALQPKIKPIKVKALMQKQQQQQQHHQQKQEAQVTTKPTIKIEPITDYPQEKRRKLNPEPSAGGSADAPKPYQAYFCRKCYKVFYKLDEFDIHVLGCSAQQQNQGRGKPGPKPNTVRSKPVAKPAVRHASLYDDQPPIIDGPLSTSGRPMRNCVREITRYMDEPVLEPEWLEEDGPKEVKKGLGGYACGICSSSFPTSHGRNSHMRFHKRKSAPHLTPNLPQHQQQQQSPPPQQPPILPQSHSIARKRPENVAQRTAQALAGPRSAQRPVQPPKPASPARPSPVRAPPPTNARSPQKVHTAARNAPSPAAAQSNFNSIMLMVQNNPNITIKTMEPVRKAASPQLQQQQQQASTSLQNSRATPPAPAGRARPGPAPSRARSDPVPVRARPEPVRARPEPVRARPEPVPVQSRAKSGPKPKAPARIPPPLIVKPGAQPQMDQGERKNYRCQGCHKPFANKSNLYFHKKNYCTGSRFPCPLCKKRFGSEEAYNSHMYYSHPE